ncbi:MAG TPA: type III-A CRISPR-associated RAMP protein Csm4, partial [bacterium (Candidatus Stahlbacteria)]|nr:type III-A CRISPR-associated RAMP protein Csm4 [Candidatus Stahlbacteria bacterium]
CHCYNLLYGDLDNFLRGFLEGMPPFLVSSAFPYWQDNYFFPVPKNQIPKEKAAKKIQFVDIIGLEKLLSGEALEKIIAEIKTIPFNKLYPWRIDNVPRIGLNRLTNHPGENFFHFGQVTYSEDAGLFVLIKFKDNIIKNKLLACLNLLVHEGIGGDRTCGRGLFEKPDFSDIELKLLSNPDAVYSLSLYYPTKNELSSIKEGYYEIEERKGYIYSPYGRSLRRRSIRMFKEGSVFPSNNERIGSLVDVTPDAFTAHKVYRYGFIFPLPCKMEVV